jgi:adenosylcobinamide-GDP ribazoletransferase
MRGLILAVQFLTRLPTPQVRAFEPADLARSAIWFPLVGALVGVVVGGALALGARVDPWLGALAAVIAWVWITGALHLDGLADLADALGAAHGDPARFLEVLKDPRKGTFGVLALVVAVLAKLVLLMLFARHASSVVATLALIAAWARLGAIAWALALPPLVAGSGERFAWRASWRQVIVWAVLLLAASASLAPALAAAPIALALYGLWLRRRVGGMSGDCLGAGIELCELALLAVALLAPRYW